MDSFEEVLDDDSDVAAVAVAAAAEEEKEGGTRANEREALMVIARGGTRKERARIVDAMAMF